MGTLNVECLRCGERHQLSRAIRRQVQESECPRCGYLGWADAADLTEPSRRQLRERPVELRRLRVVA